MCFLVEETLRERMNIPVSHDDDPGTAITAGATPRLRQANRGCGPCRLPWRIHWHNFLSMLCGLGWKREHITAIDVDDVVEAGRTRI